TMYELIILSLLMREPIHGYLISKIINDIIGPLAKVSHGWLYPRLAKLEQEGLIVTSQEGEEKKGERQLRTYHITEEGRKRFHELMMDTSSNPGEYSKFFWQKVSFLEYLHPAERLHLIDHYINYCQTHILHLKEQAKNLVEGKVQYHSMDISQLEATLHVLRRSTSHWQVDLEYANSLREKEMAQALVEPSTT
ncbi:MAG TPA: PadR family transcriptional regulator, partial [Ktedonobacteraceae bacterium]|nr:PadR family transcriptional regulator [Ktedonobacteraceae bacterium]